MRRTRIMPVIVRGALVSAIALTLACAVGWQVLMRIFVRRYYAHAYAPIRLDYRAASITTELQVAVGFRRDNARYLRERFPDEADLVRVAEAFEQAADRYAAALAAVADGVADRHEARQIATALREAAAAERAAGAALLARARGT